MDINQMLRALRNSQGCIAALAGVLATSYMYDFPEHDNEHDFVTATPSRCVHAPGEHPHRGLALSWRVAGHEFQLRAPETLHPGAGAGKVRCLLHGRPYGCAQHAARCAQAQPHGALVRAIHAETSRGAFVDLSPLTDAPSSPAWSRPY